MGKPHATLARAAATFAAVTLVLTACSDPDDEPSATAGEAATSSSAAESPSSPSSPTSEAPAPSQSQEPTPTMTSQAAAADVSTMLLPADGMGKLNAEWTWFAGNDFDIEPERLVACHRFTLDVIGVEEVAVREYTSDLDAGVRAYHLVARLPDDVTARRAYSVLQSWRADCQQRLEKRSKGDDRVRVTPEEVVGGVGEAATSYVVLLPTATGSTRVENVGIARDDRVIDMVVVKLEGDDFNYPRGRTPAAVALRNAAERR